MQEQACPNNSGNQDEKPVKKQRSETAARERVAHTPAEFAALFGRNPVWSYRLLYKGKVKAINTFGRLLIPHSEVERILSSASIYNPDGKKKK